MIPILLAAFGAMSPAARSIYAGFEAEARAAHPGREVRLAFTATSLVARLKAAGEPAWTLPEAYAALAADGFPAVAVASLHLVPGEKHQELLDQAPQGLRRAVSAPLLDSAGSIQRVAEALLAELPRDRPVLAVAHGNARQPRRAAGLLALKAALAAGRTDIHLTLLEGEPEPEALDAFLARARARGKAHLCPVLLVDGDHVRNDLLGGAPDSLRSRLGVADCTCGEALGRRPWVRRMFLARLADALAVLERP
jgi:sirohydrochlorin cobaltochelatase